MIKDKLIKGRNLQSNKSYYKIVYSSIFFPLFLLIIQTKLFNYSVLNEYLGNILSLFYVLFIWLLLIKFVYFNISVNFIKILTSLLIIKICINYFFLFFFQLPQLELDSSSFLNAYNSGDTGLINESIQNWADKIKFTEFNNQRLEFQEIYAILNNWGSIYFYSLIYLNFGNFPSTTIPWASLATGFYSLFSYLISKKIYKDEKTSQIISFIIFLLPSFLVYPLLYRDHYLILLILSVVLIIFTDKKQLGLKKIFYIFISSFILYSLRKVYFVLPLTFLIIYQFFFYKSLRKFYLYIIFLSILVICIYIYINKELFLSGSASSSSMLLRLIPDNEFFKKTIHYIITIILYAERTGGLIFNYLETFGFPINRISNLFFLLISPFPWHQSISKELIHFYIFLYLQIFISFIVYFKIFFLLIKNKIDKNFLVLFSCYCIILFLALFGALQFSSLYIMIGLPLLIISLGKKVLHNKCNYILVTSIFFILMHLFFHLLKFYLIK